MGVEDVKAKVQRYLEDIADSFEVVKNGFSIRQGSARIFVFVSDWGDGDTIVEFGSLVLNGAPKSPELFEYVARTGFNVGALSCRDGDDSDSVDVYLKHHALGEYLDPREFELALVLMARTADEIDDEMQERFGGSRFHED